MSTIFAHICTVKNRFSYKLFERVQSTNIAKYLCSVKNRFWKPVFPVAYDRVCTKPDPGKTGSLYFFAKNIRLKHICCLDCFIFEQRKPSLIYCRKHRTWGYLEVNENNFSSSPWNICDAFCSVKVLRRRCLDTKKLDFTAKNCPSVQRKTLIKGNFIDVN